jgi:hypothetical protein
MATSPIDATWKEAANFLRRQFLISRCYVPRWWWATAPLTVLQPLVLFGGVAWAGLLAGVGNASWFWPLLPSGTLYGLAVLRGHWRQTVWRSHVQGAPAVLRAAARFDCWAAPWTCLFAAGTLLTSAVGRSITWRGIHYHIGPAGRITLLGRMLDMQQRREMLAANARRLEHEKVARLAAGARPKAGDRTCTFVCGIRASGSFQKILPADSA